MPLRYMPQAPETYTMPLTIRHLLDGGEQSHQDQEIVYRDAFRMTYRELHGRIGRLAAVLSHLRVDQGTVVAVLDWDSHRYLECFFAIPMLGAVLQMANVRLSPAQLRFTLMDSGAELLLVHRDFMPLVDTMLADLPTVHTVVLIADGDPAPIPSSTAGEYEQLLETTHTPFEFVDFDEEAVATTFYTSGTTGLPKAVAFTHRQLVLHTLAVAAAVASAAGPGLRSGDVYMPLTPMFHVHAWGFPYVATMLGVKQVYPGRYDADAILRLREREGVTFSHCVPTMLRMLIDAASASGRRLDGLHLLIGGSALTNELQASATALGATPVNAFGMSETGPVIAIDQLGGCRTGTTVPLTRLRVVDEVMNPVAADDVEMGELVLRAPWLTSSYPGAPDASTALWRGGWLHTQDLATIDRRGSIVIRDRLKDVIKTGGEWVGSLALEGLIASHPDVVEVAVVGVPDPKWQERPVATIVSRADVGPTIDDINAWLRPSVDDGTLSRYALLDAVVLTEALPRTSVGKVDKRTLRDFVAARLGDQASRQTHYQLA